MQVSIIIPVYNAAPFVEKAVKSALDQDETAEVILIEDGSPDDSLSVCQRLDAEYEMVRLITHEDNQNLGAGPTRNVGIESSRYEYVAFLDADDYYLPDRFAAEKRIFEEKPETDGVYGAAGSHYYTEGGKKTYTELGFPEIYTISPRIEPHELFDTFCGIGRANGFFHLNTLTVKRTVFDRAGYFTNNFQEDSELLIKLMLTCTLEAGEIAQPVAMIGIHDENRNAKRDPRSRSVEDMYANLYQWAISTGIGSRESGILKSHWRLAKIRRSNWASAVGLYAGGCLTDIRFLTEKVFVFWSIDRILGGKLDRSFRYYRNWRSGLNP